jgi:hypothetical protein
MLGSLKPLVAVVAAPLKGIHLRIIACARSGKTETLARRAAYLLSHHVPPKSIVAFAFNADAPAELKIRPGDVFLTHIGLRGALIPGLLHVIATGLSTGVAGDSAPADLDDFPGFQFARVECDTRRSKSIERLAAHLIGMHGFDAVRPISEGSGLSACMRYLTL